MPTHLAPIRFLHIPKTAGATFTALLQRIYPGQEFAFTGNVQADLERYRQLSPAERASIQRYTGHSPRFTGVAKIDQAPTITFLRHPVARVISFCQHVREGKSLEYLEAFPPEAFDLDAFLESGDGQLFNLHTQMLLGKFADQLAALDAESAYQQALAILTGSMHSFGLTEHFDDSLLLFRREFGWPFPTYQSRNIKNPRLLLQPTQQQRQRIEAMNQLDLRLYVAAAQVFAARLDRQPLRLQLERQLFKHKQKQFQGRT